MYLARVSNDDVQGRFVVSSFRNILCKFVSPSDLNCAFLHTDFVDNVHALKNFTEHDLITMDQLCNL